MRKPVLSILSSAAIVIALAACSTDTENTEESPSEEETIEETSDSVEEDSEETEELTDEDDFSVIAHRGASGHAPESTFHAFDKAVEMDADYLEFDVQITADGELVAFHDDEISRTTDGEGAIGDHTLDELKELDAGTWFNEEYPEYADESFEGAQILTVEEIIERYGPDKHYYIETKSPEINPDMEEPLVEIVEEAGLVENGTVLLQSFSQESLEAIQDLNADIPLVQLLWWEVDDESGELVEWLDITPAPEDMTDEHFEEAYEEVAGNTYTIATDNNFVPFAFLDLETDELTGFDIELMTALSEEIGFEANFEAMEFQGALAGVQSGSYDAAINAMSITEERQENMDFSDPYYMDAGIIVAVASENEGEWDSLEDLDQDGVEIVTNQGSTSQDYLEENIENATIQALPDIVEAYQSVIQGHYDAVLYDEPNVLYYTEEQAAGQLVTVGETLLADDYGIGMPQGHELVDPINHALEVLQENGTYDDLYESYFGERPMGT